MVTTLTTFARAVRPALAALAIVAAVPAFSTVGPGAVGAVSLEERAAHRRWQGGSESAGAAHARRQDGPLGFLGANRRRQTSAEPRRRPEAGEVPLQPWAEAVYQERIETNGKDHPGARCWPSGIPEKNNIPDGVKVVQTPDLMLFLHESRTIYRQIFTDGRPLPKDAQPTWMGYSVGKWEGDTFVVETIGQNGKTWLDMRGLPGTEALRVIERFTRPDIGHIDIDVTIDDPKAYTKPWNVKLSWTLLPDTDLIESICEENNRDLPHMVGK